MKYLLLLPGSIAITLSNPFQRSLFSSLGAPLPWSYIGLGTIKGRQLFVFLSLICLCFLLGAGLNLVGLVSIPFLLSFWHLSTAVAGTSTERHLVHATLSCTFFLSQSHLNSPWMQTAVLHLLVTSGILFMRLPGGLPPAWTRAKTPLGLAPLSAVLWLTPVAPQLVLTALATIGITCWSSYALSRSLALKH